MLKRGYEPSLTDTEASKQPRCSRVAPYFRPLLPVTSISRNSRNATAPDTSHQVCCERISIADVLSVGLSGSYGNTGRPAFLASGKTANGWSEDSPAQSLVRRRDSPQESCGGSLCYPPHPQSGEEPLFVTLQHSFNFLRRTVPKGL